MGECIWVGGPGRDGFTLAIVGIGKKVDLTLLDINVPAEVEFAALIDAGPEITVITRLPVLLQYDIQDAGSASGSVILCPGVRDDLHALDRVCGDLVQGQGRG